MRHFCSRGLVVALQRVEPQVDAGRQHQPLEAKRHAVRKANGARVRVHLHRRLRRDSNASGGELPVAELLRLEIAQACDGFVAERAGEVKGFRFDQRHLKRRIEPAQRARAKSATKSAADHDDAPCGLRPRRARQGERCRGRGDAAKDVSPRLRARNVHEQCPGGEAAAFLTAAASLVRRR